MAANGVNTSEDAEMSLCEGDSVVTMMDVLKEQQDFEDDANAVLGASDDKNCTYSKGYVKRQAIYACLTCCPEAKADPSKRAGVCLACSLNCHENHELVELYTKRNFRCDCGNPKFGSHPCQFTPDKNDLNYENKYNQNFSGIYCVCHRPYPDPEAVEDEEMLQCIVCEDWLHTKHLEATVPHNDLYEEMICKDCMEEYDFLHDYSDLVVNVVDKEVVVDEFDFDFDLQKSSRKGKSKKSVANGKLDVKSDKLDDKAETLLTNGKEKGNEETDSENVNDKVDEISSGNVEDKVNEVSDKLTSNENNDSKMEISSSEVEKKDSDKTDESEVNSEKLTNTESNDSKIEIPSSEVENKDDKSDAEVPADNLKPEETMNGEPQSEGKKAESIISDENKTDSIETKENTEESEKVEESTEKSEVNDENTTEHNEKPDIAGEQSKNDSEDQEKIEEDRLLQDNEEADTVAEKKSELPDTADTKNEDETTNETKNEDETMNETKNEDKETTVPAESSEAMETENNDTSEKKEDNTAESNPDTTKADEANEAAPNTLENSDSKRKLSDETADEVIVKKPKLDGKPCIRPRGKKRVYKGATFWPSNLRQKLCTCNECISMYKDLAVLFLTDPEDTVNAYEALGKEISEGPSSQYEKGLQALSSLDRVQQINALTEYNKMRDKLLDFLKGYKDRKEIVKEEDIKSFFAGMKPKREPDGVYFCR